MLSATLFVLYLLLPAGVWLLRQRIAHSRIQFLALFCVTVTLGYFLYVEGVLILDQELKQNVDRYDLDHDGGFSDEELTPEAQVALKAYTSDTGRTFAPILAAPLTVIWVSICFSFFAFLSWIATTVSGPKPHGDAAATPVRPPV